MQNWRRMCINRPGAHCGRGQRIRLCLRRRRKSSATYVFSLFFSLGILDSRSSRVMRCTSKATRPAACRTRLSTRALSPASPFDSNFLFLLPPCVLSFLVDPLRSTCLDARTFLTVRGDIYHFKRLAQLRLFRKSDYSTPTFTRPRRQQFIDRKSISPRAFLITKKLITVINQTEK